MDKQNFTKMLLCDGTPQAKHINLSVNIINRTAKIAVLSCSLTSVKGNDLLFTSIHSVHLFPYSLRTNSARHMSMRFQSR